MKKLYYHGNIITMENENEKVEAVLIEDDMIKATGTFSKLKNEIDQNDLIIDLKGKTMLPGFIDSHSHFTAVATSLDQCDLSEVNSFEILKQTLKDYIKDNQIEPGQWVCGFNYDHNYFVEQRHPDRFLLDSVSTKHPIVIGHISSHMGVVNSLALKMMHLDKNTNDFEGGHYGRQHDSNELNGYLEEKAYLNFLDQKPMPSINRVLELMEKAQQVYLANGITTVQEGLIAKPLLQLLKLAKQQDLFKIDLIGYLDLKKCHDLLQAEPELLKYDRHFKIGGYKIFLDGSPQGKTAWMEEPYLDSGDYCGYPMLDDDSLYNLIKQSIEAKQQLLAHCNGDKACNQYITQFERYLAQHPNANLYRPVMIHSQFVTENQLERMKKLAMIPSFFIGHTYYWGDVHLKNVGVLRASRISPAKTALNKGLIFTIHNDSPVVSCNMLKTLWCAINRKTRAGKILGDQERISVYQGLKALTINGAYQYHEEHLKGSIKANKKADLVILDNDPSTMSSLKVDTIKVIETIKDGKTVYQKGQ